MRCPALCKQPAVGVSQEMCIIWRQINNRNDLLCAFWSWHNSVLYKNRFVKGNETKRSKKRSTLLLHVAVWAKARDVKCESAITQRSCSTLSRGRHSGEDGNTVLFNSDVQLNAQTQGKPRKLEMRWWMRIPTANSALEITARQWLWKPCTIPRGINNLGKAHIKGWISLTGLDRWTSSLG